MRKVLKANMFRMKIENFSDGQLFVYFQQFVYFSQISHLEAFSTKTAHNKDVCNDNLEFFEVVSCLFTFSSLFTFLKKATQRLLTQKLLKAKMLVMKI